MTKSDSPSPTSTLRTPEVCRSGMQPAETWEIRSPRELLALPQRIHAYQEQHPGAQACGIVSYDAGVILAGISLPDETQNPLACVHIYAPDQIQSAPVSTAGFGAKNRTDYRLRTPFSAEQPDQEYLEAVRKIQEYETSGDCYQVNYARRFCADADGDPYTAFLALDLAHPAPWASFFSLAGGAVFGASPECFIRTRDRRITAEPIKGSRPRGSSAAADTAIAMELCKSHKDRAENLMIVDLLRNDLGKVSQTGSVATPALFELKQFSNVQHLVSTVQATLHEGTLPLSALLTCFPGGSITGAPKKRAMEIICELEQFNRGFYCGTQFWIDAKGNVDANILIRTFQWFGQTIVCHGGGGIVADSVPGNELEESEFKVRALMTALESGRY